MRSAGSLFKRCVGQAGISNGYTLAWGHWTSLRGALNLARFCGANQVYGRNTDTNTGTNTGANTGATERGREKYERNPSLPRTVIETQTDIKEKRRGSVAYNVCMFTDQVVIHVKSGKGGDGMVHFRREKFVPLGGPDGGDGGKGGDVIFEVKPTLNTLSSFRQNQKFKADEGVKGGPSQMSGRYAEDLILYVPPGTVIFDADTGELIGDLTEPGQQLTILKGGRGGRGNQHFATSRNQVPRTAEKGEPAQERRLKLELKLIADIGLIGVPNAGKSTLLSVLTNAKPKIALLSIHHARAEPRRGKHRR